MKLTSRLLVTVLLCALTLSVPIAAQADGYVYRGQIALRELGYAPGPPDGVYGPRTRDAIRRFQRDHRLAVTGHFNDATVSRLRSLVDGRHHPPRRPPR